MRRPSLPPFDRSGAHCVAQTDWRHLWPSRLTDSVGNRSQRDSDSPALRVAIQDPKSASLLLKMNWDAVADGEGILRILVVTEIG